MHTKIASIWMALILLAAPATLHAAAPEPVAGLGAAFVDDVLTISWDQLEQDDIAFYQILYSSESIIKNSGEYDDFEITDGPKGEYEFEALPGSGKMYFAVVGVTTEGETGAGIAEEVVVEMPSPEALPEEVIAEVPEEEMMIEEPEEEVIEEIVADMPEEVIVEEVMEEKPASGISDTTLKLISASASKPSEVVLNFSHDIVISPDDAPQAFKIVQSDGTELRILRMNVEGKRATVETDVQVANEVYEIGLSEPLKGNPNLPLDPLDRTTFFSGHRNGKVKEEPVPAAQVAARTETSPPVGPPADLESLAITATKQPNDLYHASITWNKDRIGSNVANLIVAQSNDGGETFMDRILIQPEVTSLEFDGIYSDDVGAKIQTINWAGEESEGKFISIHLPTGTVSHDEASAPLVANVTETSPTPSPVTKGDSVAVISTPPSSLPQSGNTLMILLIGVLGIFGGLLVTRMSGRSAESGSAM